MGSELAQLYDNLRALLGAGTWEQLHHLAAGHPDLAGPGADALIVDWLDQNPHEDPALVAAVRRVRFVLARCRTVGIDAAFADFIANTPHVDASGEHPVSMSIGVILRCVADAYDTAPETLPAFKDAVEPLLPETKASSDVSAQALLWWCLGLCYHRLPTGDRRDNLVAAIDYVTRFLSVSPHRREPFPLEVLSTALADLVLVVGPDLRLADVEAWLETLQQAAAALPEADVAGRYDNALLRAAAYLMAHDGVRTQRVDEAIVLLEEVVKESGRLGRPAHRARAENLLGEALRLRAFTGTGDRLQRALDLFAEVEAAYQAEELDDRTREEFLFRVRVRTNLALALTQRVRGRRAEDRDNAVRLLRGNLQALSANGIRTGRQRIARHLSDAYGWENFGRAVAALRLALRYGSRDDNPESWAEAHAQCGRVYASAPTGGNIERAIWHLGKALEVYKPPKYGQRWADLQVMLGTAYANRAKGSRSENVDASVGCLRAALAIEDPARDQERNRARRLGDVLFLAQRWTDAHEAYRRAIAAGLFVLVRAQSGEALRAEIDTFSRLSARSALCLLRLGRPAAALYEVEEGRTRILARSLDPDSGLAHLPKEDQDRLALARATLAEVEFERASLAEGTPWRRSEFSLSKASETAGRTVAELVSPVHNATGASPLRLSHKEILAIIPEGGALVVPLVTEAGSVAYVISAGAEAITDSHVLPLSQSTAHDLRVALRGAGEDYYGWLRAYFQRPRTLAAESESGVPGELWTELLEHFSSSIWSALMGPIHERLGSLGLARGAPVVLVGTSEICMLPLAAARARTPGARAFVDDYALAVAPSLLSLHTAFEHARQAAEAEPRLLAIVDPQDNLPFAMLEGAVLSRQQERVPVRIVASTRATREEVTRRLPNYPLVHFACHAVFDLDDPMGSRVELAGSTRLTLADLITLRPLARSSLVVLSACETAVTDADRAPEESTGFPLGFIEAGAAAVVSTLWEVNDLSTMLIVEQFYQRFLRGLAPAQALRGAQLWLRDVTAGAIATRFREERKRAAPGPAFDAASRAWRRFAAMEPDSRPFDHPYFWAPFVYTGIWNAGLTSIGPTQHSR